MHLDILKDLFLNFFYRLIFPIFHICIFIIKFRICLFIIYKENVFLNT